MKGIGFVGNALAGVLLLAMIAGVAAADPSATATTPGGVEALAATLEVEKTLLAEDRERHDELVAKRLESAARATSAQARLDAALHQEAKNYAEVEALIREADQLERERTDRLAEERAVVERIRERMRRIALLEERLAAFQTRAGEAAGPLAGAWEVVLMPSGQKGTFVLSQSGTIVSGTYTLDGGWSGSLQGTLVNRKVYLDRIDSKLGRWGRFEGWLAADGARIRGSWTALDLGAQGGAEGQWGATRRAAQP